MYGKDRIFLTPNYSEWNPYCESYSYNESILTNYEGDITSIENQNKILMEPAIDPNEIFEMANVQTIDYDTAVDSAIIRSFKATSQDTSRYDTDAGFASCLNTKAEESKFGATIGSTTSSKNDCCLFKGQTHLTLTSEELEESLSSILDD